MGKAIRASVLVLVFACSAQAGYIHNDVKGTPPPPPPTVTQEEQTAEGEVQDGAAGGLTETVLSVIGSLLALL